MTPQGVKVGDRIRLTRMPDDPLPIEAGTEGTVHSVSEVRMRPYWWSIGVTWDNGRGLSLSVPPDEFVIIPNQTKP